METLKKATGLTEARIKAVFDGLKMEDTKGTAKIHDY